MHYYFFDIDGTLLLSGGAGRVAMTRVMNEMFGLTQLHRVDVQGRTDRGIVEDLFEKHEIGLDDSTRLAFTSRYHELLPESMHQCEGCLMPGVTGLLNNLSGLKNTRIGLLTGNSESAAWTKLRHFELDHFFEFGGYGDLYSKRDDVAALALQNCRERYPNHSIQPEQTWIVGDTIHDISCARSIGARVVAVATGGSDHQQLDRHQPDVLLQDLSNHDDFLAATQS